MFVEFPKIPRLRREVSITEKIDGTNAAIAVREVPYAQSPVLYYEDQIGYLYGRNFGGLDSNKAYGVFAQSRSRLISVNDDNFGFARWVHDNMVELAETLGTGVHFGEWWGSGVNRGYGLQKGEKRFSLFNRKRWSDLEILSPVVGLGVVPEVTHGILSTQLVDDALEDLRMNGSKVVPGFKNPEGVVVYHVAANASFKVLLENDDTPKGNPA